MLLAAAVALLALLRPNVLESADFSDMLLSLKSSSRMYDSDVFVQVSTRILSRRMAPFSSFLIPLRVPHGLTPRS